MNRSPRDESYILWLLKYPLKSNMEYASIIITGALGWTEDG